jgi:hypothetical protein
VYKNRKVYVDEERDISVRAVPFYRLLATLMRRALRGIKKGE